MDMQKEPDQGGKQEIVKAGQEELVPEGEANAEGQALVEEAEKGLVAPETLSEDERKNAEAADSDPAPPRPPFEPITRRVTRSPTRIEWDDSGVSRRSLLLLMTTALVLGGLIGSLLTRQRYRARDVIVAVNGEVVDKSYFYHRMELVAGVPVMRSLIAEDLQLQYAKQLGVMPSDAEVDAKFDKAARDPDFARMLDSTRQLPEDYKQRLRVELAQNGVVARGMQVTDGDIRRFYAANILPANPKSLFYKPESVQIAVIVTDTQEQIQRAYQEMRDGNPFDLVARVYSVDDSRASGGQMPTVQKGRSDAASIPGLEATIFTMKVGEMTLPRQFSGKWWIIRCLDHTRARVQPFEEVADESRIGAMVAKGLAVNEQQIRAGFAEFQRNANLQVFYPQYADIVNLSKGGAQAAKK